MKRGRKPKNHKLTKLCGVCNKEKKKFVKHQCSGSKSSEVPELDCASSAPNSTSFESELTVEDKVPNLPSPICVVETENSLKGNASYHLSDSQTDNDVLESDTSKVPMTNVADFVITFLDS